MHRFILFCIASSVVLCAEPSVYGNSGTYVSAEKIAKKNQSSVISLQQEVSQLKQDIEGLKSIVEGLSLTLNQMQQKQANTGNSNTQANQQLIQDLGGMIDKINNNYVSKAELQKALTSGKVTQKSTTRATKKVAKKSEVKKSEAKKPKTKKDNSLENADSSALYSRGVRLVKQKKYSMAKIRFDILSRRGYKNASSSFYLGEIAYRTKNYSDAIDHYKTSAGANEKASYMDTLLLHTGISLEKKGDKSQAKRFFQAIVDGYPDSGSAKVAKRHL